MSTVGNYGVLTYGHEKYESVKHQFYETWKHPASERPRPKNVVRILGITCPTKIAEAYVKYKANLERRGKFSTRGMQPGNERRRWHGTVVQGCKMLGNDLPVHGKCDDDTTKCVLCSIINTGFRKPKPVTPSNQMFGFGVYFTATSSKSDGYTGKRTGNNIHAGRERRCLILNKIAVGRAIKLPKASENLVRPPNGYDSVIGEPGATANLKYDELIVYDTAAILPAYVIVYE
ncbi:putative adp-ribosylation [Lyophyllum shimeji]|uniref:Adp-ribosylation n=1 Tax=Lyophyllum shimeji TaxID=47721 RepID=A0A9P3PRC8_LYOSH|nr:putative adp-ribosylation [Lyophyllum shimeji]